MQAHAVAFATVMEPVVGSRKRGRTEIIELQLDPYLWNSRNALTYDNPAAADGHRATLRNGNSRRALLRVPCVPRHGVLYY